MLQSTIILALVLVQVMYCGGLERDLTISVDPGKSDCFFQSANAGQIIDIEYQVIDGGQGSLDIGFVLLAPGGRVLFAPGRRQAGAHRGAVGESGDYHFCFDNTHSKFNAKTVYFDLMIDTESDEDDEDDEADVAKDKQEGAEVDSEAFGRDWQQRLLDLVSKIRHNLAGARRLQEAVSVTAARDLHYAERSLSRVTHCSIIQAAAMLAVGILQVIMVRSLFDETSPLYGLLKKLPIGRS